MPRRPAVILAVLVFLLVPVAASAQSITGTIQGTVTDKSGAALPGVTVAMRNVETRLERVVITDGNGFFNAPYLPIGRYNVRAELSGLGAISRENVAVDLNQTTVQDFILAPSLSETITVEAEAPRINVSDGEIKQTMRSREIMSLPSSDQTSFTRLASVFSGYQENPTSGQDNPALSSGSSVNFNGTGTRGTTFQINGVNNDDSSENQHRQNVPLATIQSFQIVTNNYNAEIGRGYGAVVLVQTKQGTNNLAGEVYGYATDAKYRSRDILQVSLSHGTAYRREYGFTAGFPIIRDRLFMFGNMQQVQNRGLSTQTRGLFLPSDLDPAKRLTLGNNTPANRAWQDSILAYFPTGVTPNAPNIATRAYQGEIFNTFPGRDLSTRLDFLLNNSNNLTGRYQRTHNEIVPGELIRGEAAPRDLRQSTVGLAWTNTLSSDTVQEARYGLGLRFTSFSLSGGDDLPVVRFAGTGVPTFTILGNAGALPVIRNQRDQQFIYNISSSRWARHTLKVGTDLLRKTLNDRADNFNRGFWNFGSSCGGVNYGNGLAAFWAGCVSSYTIAYGPNDLQNRLWEANVYAQDDWRPWDNLTLNLGVRFERVGAPEETEDRIQYGFGDTSYIDPRLGFAYTPNWDGNRVLRAITGGNGKFSIRGGYGTFHGRVFQSVFSQGGASVRFNPPNAILLGFTNSTNLADPTNGFTFVPGTFPTTRVSPTYIQPDLQMPETRQWNLTFERQTFWNSRLRLSYIGTIGKDLLQYRLDNLPVAPAPFGTPGAPWVVAQDVRCAGTGFVAGVTVNLTCPTPVPIAANEVSLRVTRTNERRPDSRFTDVRHVENFAKTWYHGGQLEWEVGEYRGFGGRMTYTYSKAIDTGSEATFVGQGDVNAFGDNSDKFRRGLSRFDTRHRVTATGRYALPWLKERQDWIGSVLGGWTLSTAIRLASGTPFTIVDSAAPDVFFLGPQAPARPICVKPEYCGGWYVNTRQESRNEMPRDAFRRAQYGDKVEDFVGRNTFFTDGAETVDAGLYKTFKFGAGTALMLRFDMFNVFNRVTWWYPVNDFASANFGTLNVTNYTPRTMQLGFRFMY